MKKMRMCFPREKTFEDGFKEYVLDYKARNLREGTINHYQEIILPELLFTAYNCNRAERRFLHPIHSQQTKRSLYKHTVTFLSHQIMTRYAQVHSHGNVDFIQLFMRSIAIRKWL